MSGIAHHLVRRGIEATQQNYYQGSVEVTVDGEEGQLEKLPVWGLAALSATFLLFMFVQFVVSRRP